ncbi:MAG: PhzF family phenazine biosynthesis protein [Candidatus Rokubacteria bacterium]|nr:PhzF family phenazine biosynthesis protein [Candidatus Rokubacteria bacterium]
MSVWLPIVQVNAFTSLPFAGNPAAVVLDAEALSEAQMQRIAAEMKLPGTAFVSRPAGEGTDLRLRTFTPTREVNYSGHTTLAAVHAMIEAGRLPGDGLVFDTPGGRLGVQVERKIGGTSIWLLPRLPSCVPFEGQVPALLETLGLTELELSRWAPTAVTPDADLLVPVRGLEALRRLQPDMERVATFGERNNLRGICVVSKQTVDPDSTTHCRFFAPHYGIPEDFVTGSVHSAVGVWLLEARQVPVIRDHAEFIAEQGDMLGRPGRLFVDVLVASRKPARVRVGGRAVTVLSGSLRLP